LAAGIFSSVGFIGYEIWDEMFGLAQSVVGNSGLMWLEARIFELEVTMGCWFKFKSRHMDFIFCIQACIWYLALLIFLQ
jgi:hypothetical protein